MYAFYILIFYMLYSLIAQDFWQEEKVHCVRTQCLLLTFWNHASSSSENSLTSSEEFHFCLKTTIIHPPTAQPKRFSINPETNTINNFNFISQQTSDDCSSRMKAGVLCKRCLSLTVYMRNSNSDAWLHKTSVIFHLVGHVEQWTLLERIKNQNTPVSSLISTICSCRSVESIHKAKKQSDLHRTESADLLYRHTHDTYEQSQQPLGLWRCTRAAESRSTAETSLVQSAHKTLLVYYLHTITVFINYYYYY